ncbi:hypothetical protein [Falsiroseomonas ponticola]|uniref:hypothetical protein n=1 Tax=Falsiroseomonas ponticola TaxID=2786951 RepID=UPI001933CBEA|nr:hypothetical protein [Roseomonas ponticola]
MSKPPFTKDEMFDELRLVVRVMANHLAQYGSTEAAELLTGFETDNPLYPYAEDDPDKFDLSRFAITAFMDLSYDYAFQVGRPSRFDDDRAQDINEFRHGVNLQSTDGNASPMAIPDSKCRIVVDMAFARWQLERGDDLTVRELALLAGMKEAAVRNSLSADLIKVEAGRRAGEPGTVDGNVAYGWLRKRRGFIDSRDPEMRAQNRRSEYRALLRERSLAYAFEKILKEGELSVDDLAAKADVAPAFLTALANGKPPLDLKAAQRVGEALDVDVPSFVGAVVEAALRQI